MAQKRLIITNHLPRSIGILGDATSPASNLAITALHSQQLEDILELWGEKSFSFGAYPASLLREVLKVNRLRDRASKLGHKCAAELTHEAYEVLSYIQNFLPEEFGESTPGSKKDWTLLGHIYRAATIIYCIASLQSVSVLALTPFLRSWRVTTGQTLQENLREAMNHLKFRIFLVWPMVVLGVEAVNGGAGMRGFVQDQLPELSHYMGTNVPLKAKEVLQKFWVSGQTRWDACFDQPYSFATQLAVDTSKLR
jgi:hypothetical protein